MPLMHLSNECHCTVRYNPVELHCLFSGIKFWCQKYDLKIGISNSSAFVRYARGRDFINYVLHCDYYGSIMHAKYQYVDSYQYMLEHSYDAL